MRTLIPKLKRFLLTRFPDAFVRPIPKRALQRSRPFTSQNTWERILKFYNSRGKPGRILEYGSGLSTFWHLENLKNAGGELVSIEDDLLWFAKLKKSFCRAYGSELSEFYDTTTASSEARGMDWSFSGRMKTDFPASTVTFRYLYRPGNGRTGCGTFEEFRGYVTAPTGAFDIVIIDGRARKACVSYVLEKNLLNVGGLLVLFEAGRGHPCWPKKSQMEGTYDYRPEVRKLLAMGAELVDGTGYERWTGWTPNRELHEYFSTHVPMEACFWIKK